MSRKFLWPMDVVRAENTPSLFGYVMPWRDERFVDFKDVLMNRARQPTFRSLVTAAIETASAYNNLHADGFCYKDISLGNIAIDPDSGEIRICDNDNVDVHNVEITAEHEGGVAGTLGFMAPEIIDGLATSGKARPNRATDQWSLAVLFFWMLVRDDPLVGSREGPLFDEYSTYGLDACFIFDQHDVSNRPVPGRHKNAIRFWPVLPQFIRSLFTKSFSEGIRDPNRRVFEADWRKAMVRLRNAITLCTQCGSENFYDCDAAIPARCWSCSHSLAKPLILDLGGIQTTVALTENTDLFTHHLRAKRNFDFERQLAKVVRIEGYDDALGLKNLSDDTWTAAFGSKESAIGPKGTVILHPGLRIDFGQVEGLVS